MANIGLTGRIACGKSTVSKMLSEAGFRIVDCDKVAHELLFQPAIKKAIAAQFGHGVFVAGEVYRPALGAVVFEDCEARFRLEAIMRPPIYQRVEEIVKSSSDPLVIDCFELVGTPLQALVNEVWVVTCSKEQQLKRLMARNKFTEELALRRMNAQKSQEEMLKDADVVIDNCGSLEKTEAQVLRELRRLTWR